jgi:hypothetical protein
MQNDANRDPRLYPAAGAAGPAYVAKKTGSLAAVP